MWLVLSNTTDNSQKEKKKKKALFLPFETDSEYVS